MLAEKLLIQRSEQWVWHREGTVSTKAIGLNNGSGSVKTRSANETY